MIRSIARALLVLAALLPLLALQARALPQYARRTGAACASCHASPAGGAGLNAVGQAYRADSTKAPPPASGIPYVGHARCRSCHLPQHRAWTKTEHATAMKSLHADEDELKAFAKKLGVELQGHAAGSDACVSCHVTGFRLGGGFPAADSARTANLGMVGWESCHGPGARHVTAPLADKKEVHHPEPDPDTLPVLPHTRHEPRLRLREVPGEGRARAAVGALIPADGA